MSENDVRRAMADLAGTVPMPVPGARKGAVMARISSAQRRRLAAQAAFSGFVLATASLGAVRLINPSPAGMDTVLQEPSAKPEPTYVKPSPSPTKSKPPAPKPTASPKPAYVKPEPAKTTKKPVATTKPVTGTPLAVEFYNATDGSTAGSPTDLKVKVFDGAGRLLRVEVAYGDGTKKVVEPAGECGSGVEWKQYFSHTYAAGSYAPRVTVTTGGCGAATETKSRTIELKVGAAKPEAPGNGPSQPTVSADKTLDGALLGLVVSGADADGFVKKFWIDWGDGSETYVGPRSLDLCEPGKPSQWEQAREHSYAEPGTYTVKVTVMSVNCDGGEGQTATTTLTVTV